MPDSAINSMKTGISIKNVFMQGSNKRNSNVFILATFVCFSIQAAIVPVF